MDDRPDPHEAPSGFPEPAGKDPKDISETEGVDPVTQDVVIDILRDEQGHRRLFEGFLRECELEGRA